jgi:hypothetical protein
MMKGKMADIFIKARRMSVCRIPTEGMKTRPTKRQPKKDPKRSKGEVGAANKACSETHKRERFSV